MGDQVTQDLDPLSPEGPEAQQLWEVVAGLPLVLKCQVSLPDAPVHWLKDSEVMVPT